MSERTRCKFGVMRNPPILTEDSTTHIALHRKRDLVVFNWWLRHVGSTYIGLGSSQKAIRRRKQSLGKLTRQRMGAVLSLLPPLDTTIYPSAASPPNTRISERDTETYMQRETDNMTSWLALPIFLSRLWLLQSVLGTRMLARLELAVRLKAWCV